MRQKRPDAAADRDKALHRQQVGRDREHIDQEIGQHKNRHGKPEHSEDHDHPVDPRAGLPRCHHPHRDRHEDGDDQGRDRQGYCRLDPLRDQLGDRQVGEDRDAEIAVQQTPHPGHELYVKRLVEPEFRADPDNVVQCRGVPGDDDRRVARAQMQQREDEQRHHRHDRDRRQNAPHDIGEHVLRPHLFSTFHRKTTGAMMMPSRFSR